MISECRTDIVATSQESLRSLAESVIDAYEMRASAVSGMMRQAYELVRSYQQNVEKALSTLRINMAKEQSLRCCDFDKAISGVIDANARRERQVLEHLDAFAAQEEEMITRLRRITARGKAADLADLGIIQDDILTRQKAREREVIGILRSFEIEEHELCAALRWLLSKGETATVAHLRAMVDALTTRWAAKEKDVFEMVEQLEAARGRVRDRWQQVVESSS